MDPNTQPAMTRHLAHAMWHRLTGAVRRGGGALALTLAMLVVVSGFLFVFAQAHVPPGSSPTTSLSAGTPTSTPFAQSKDGTPQTDATPTFTGTAGPGPADATQTPVPFYVTQAHAVPAQSDSFSGVCSLAMPMTFTVSIGLLPNGPGGTLKYWTDGTEDGINSEIRSGSVEIAPGETHKEISFTQVFSALDGNGLPHYPNWGLTYPVPGVNQTPPTNITSDPFQFTCERHITALTMTASPASWSAPCASTQEVTFTYEVRLTPGPTTINATVEFEDSGSGFAEFMYFQPFGLRLEGASSYYVNGVHETNTTYRGIVTRHLVEVTPNGTYWMKLNMSDPRQLTTGQVTVTKSC